MARGLPRIMTKTHRLPQWMFPGHPDQCDVSRVAFEPSKEAENHEQRIDRRSRSRFNCKRSSWERQDDPSNRKRCLRERRRHPSIRNVQFAGRAYRGYGRIHRVPVLHRPEPPDSGKNRLEHRVAPERYGSLAVTASYGLPPVGCGEARQTGRIDEKHPCFSPLRALRVPILSRRIGAGLHGARRVPDQDGPA
jgi:hypothetical protein